MPESESTQEITWQSLTTFALRSSSSDLQSDTSSGPHGIGESRGEGTVGASVGRSLAASAREAGVGCPHCAVDVAVGDPVTVCQACGTVHHQSCWTARGGCGSYHCAPARRTDLATHGTEPVLLITAADIDRAIPMGVGALPHRAGPAMLDAEGRSRGPSGAAPGGR